MLASTLVLTACGTPAAAAAGSIVIEPSTCLAGISPWVTLSVNGETVQRGRLYPGEAPSFRVSPGTYVLSDRFLVEQVTVNAGQILRLSVLPVCSPRMS